MNVGSTDVQLDSDLQIDYLYVSSNVSYYSPSYGTTTDGTDAVSPCLYGNMYNLRIGRGVVPTNSNYCTWAQVQGGYYNHNSSEYRLVIETGKYYYFDDDRVSHELIDDSLILNNDTYFRLVDYDNKSLNDNYIK